MGSIHGPDGWEGLGEKGAPEEPLQIYGGWSYGLSSCVAVLASQCGCVRRRGLCRGDQGK